MGPGSTDSRFICKSIVHSGDNVDFMGRGVSERSMNFLYFQGPVVLHGLSSIFVATRLVEFVGKRRTLLVGRHVSGMLGVDESVGVICGLIK